MRHNLLYHAKSFTILQEDRFYLKSSLIGDLVWVLKWHSSLGRTSL